MNIADAFDSVKQTPLHYSMTNTRWGVMETLVKAGADLNTRRMKDGWTPLFLACIFGYTYKAKYLVDSGADVLLADDLGWRPEDWADKYGLPAVSKILKYEGGKMDKYVY
jgi:ankyrin repeat protein